MKNKVLFYEDFTKDCIVKNNNGVFVDSIFIEGHTDNVPFIRGNKDINLQLSANRATETYELMTSHKDLKNFISPDNDEIFGVSAFGETRPLNKNETDLDKQKNRRIDIRLIMYIPRSSRTLNYFKDRLCNEFKYTEYCT